MKQTVREMIIQNLRSFPDVIFDEHALKDIEQRVARYSETRNLFGLVHTISCNWAIDQRRAKAAAVRMQVKRTEQLLAEERARQKRAAWEAAEKEFWTTADRALSSVKAKIRGTVSNWFLILWDTIFAKMDDTALAAKFPGTTRVARRQWRRRGRRLLKGFASPQLWEVLAWDMHNP